MYYRKEMTAAYYDCDVNNLLKPSGILRYMQQTSSEHLQSIDMAPEKLYAENMVFLLSKTNLKIHRQPLCSEKISVGTAAVAIKGPRFIREFVMDTLDGERLVSGYSLWVLTDIANHKIMRPSAYPYPFPLEPSGLNDAIGDVPIPKEKDLSPQLPKTHAEIPVRYSHMDINAHVNNCVYADFICDALPFGQLTAKGADTLVISFQNEARYGETLALTTTQITEWEYKVTGTHGGSPCFDSFVLLKK